MASSPAFAQAITAPVEERDSSFALGQIVVTGQRPEGVSIGIDTIGSQAMATFNRNTLDDAATLIPGVVAGNSGGSRNERLLFVRGFDRFQVPLSIDGIRVYLPADNRLDYGRFVTPDLAEIQVAKGYASVLDGPGAMGGAVNLVTRKPTQPLEVEARGTLNLGRNADYNGYTVSGLIGTRHDKWYAMVSYARNFQDHWDLSGDFTPTANEDGGKRDLSRSRDWRVNAKIGLTPNATDEYSISYLRQEGSKNAPLHVTEPIATQRNWSWPYWNIESVYFLSTTALGDMATLKTRAYYNTLDNLLRAFDDRTQTSQTRPRAFNSPYADKAYGGSAELAVQASGSDTMSLALFYRRDEHNETQQSFPAGTWEPNQKSVEDMWSIAAENKLALSSQLRFTVGASYDWRDLDRAEEYSQASGLFSYPLRSAGAWNAQGRIDWTPDPATTLHASISSRARFPTLFERFSSQFGTAVANPDLKAERGTNFELGGTRDFGIVNVTAALFYSHLDDALVSVRTPANLNRRENFGSADYYGGEISITARITPTLDAGVNYSYIHRDFDVGTPASGDLIRPFALTDVPDHKGFAYVSWRPLEGLEIVPNLEFASDRTTVTPASANGLSPVYYDTGSYVTAGLTIDYAILPQVTLSVGGRNLFDRNYVLTDGFPEPGRTLFASIRARY
ncbi:MULTISPECIES: TonB-dependent receptor plug domain-containing protein [Sphingomonas]|uniref:TonB-dependent receptor plug domain-containing protein n=1 Tax=Sphingomonadales TaxID=204457 RepID=UPI001F1EA6D8|nr:MULTISPECIES: TonB-dependent receptor [Sphingomonas]